MFKAILFFAAMSFAYEAFASELLNTMIPDIRTYCSGECSTAMTDDARAACLQGQAKHSANQSCRDIAHAWGRIRGYENEVNQINCGDHAKLDNDISKRLGDSSEGQAAQKLKDRIQASCGSRGTSSSRGGADSNR